MMLSELSTSINGSGKLAHGKIAQQQFGMIIRVNFHEILYIIARLICV